MCQVVLVDLHKEVEESLLCGSGGAIPLRIHCFESAGFRVVISSSDQSSIVTPSGCHRMSSATTVVVVVGSIHSMNMVLSGCVDVPALGVTWEEWRGDMLYKCIVLPFCLLSLCSRVLILSCSLLSMHLRSSVCCIPLKGRAFEAWALKWSEARWVLSS